MVNKFGSLFAKDRLTMCYLRLTQLQLAYIYCGSHKHKHNGFFVPFFYSKHNKLFVPFSFVPFLFHSYHLASVYSS